MHYLKSDEKYKSVIGTLFVLIPRSCEEKLLEKGSL